MIPLPNFENPPVVEVAISLQFKQLRGLKPAHFGLFWQRLRTDNFEAIEEHVELEPEFEDFDLSRAAKPGIKIQTFDTPPPVRLWFLNGSRDRLVQVQRDRLIVNWRKGGQASTYPRYPAIIQSFRDTLEKFKQFLDEEKLGEVEPNQCEVTYVNHIESGAVWKAHGQLNRVFTLWSGYFSDGYLREPEDASFGARFRMLDEANFPVGRLHVECQPAHRTADQKPIFILTLTARGRPPADQLDDVYRQFDREREWIVRGFTSLTTPEMHSHWRRTDV